VKNFKLETRITVPERKRLIRPIRAVSLGKDAIGLGWQNSSESIFLVEDKTVEPVEALPIYAEFFSRDLQEVDTESLESIIAFCSLYGIALSPLYDSYQHFTKSATIKTGLGKNKDTFDSNDPELLAATNQASEEASNFLSRSGTLSKDSTDFFFAVRETLAGQHYAQKQKKLKDLDGERLEHGGVVSLTEISETLRLLQNATILVSTVDALDNPLEIVNYLLSAKHRQLSGAAYFLEDFDVLLTTETNAAFWIGEATQRAFDFLCCCKKWAQDLLYPNLTGSIVEQFFSVLNDNTEWHICESESCGRIFKFHEGTNDKARSSRFCRVNCNKIQSRRNLIAKSKEAGTRDNT
jgi:hypothetical protein